jgi:methionyl-tRNA formyltransferase
MGTPDFAVASLAKLIENGVNIVGIVTATDKMGGRGGKELLQSDVKKYALQHDIPILQPEKLKSEEFHAQLRDLKADLQVVVAFRMLPQVVWQMPRLGTINLHGSLLPKYRGAAPINWAIINGEKETGVTTFFLQHEIDTGDLIDQARIEIGEDETFEDVYNRLKVVGADLLLQTLQNIEKGTYSTQPQDLSQVCHAPKIFKETCEMNIAEKTTVELHNFVRGLSPHPAAWTKFDGNMVKIYRTTVELTGYEVEPAEIGRIISNPKRDILAIQTRDGRLHIEELQMEKRKRVTKRDFLNGYKFQNEFIG